MEAQIAQFTDFTGVPAEQAQYFLEAAGGNLELAMEIFLSQAEGGQMAMDEGSDGAGESEGEDGSDYDDEDAEMPALLGADSFPPANTGPTGAPPPSKRPKVEMRQARARGPAASRWQLTRADEPPACPRQAPSMPEASAEVLASLQRVFGLGAKPKDAADGLHRVVKERMHSWAYSADRGLPYLLNCYKRVLAASSEARCVSALGGGGQGEMRTGNVAGRGGRGGGGGGGGGGARANAGRELAGVA